MAAASSGTVPSAVAAASTNPGVTRQPAASTISASPCSIRPVSSGPVQAISPSATNIAEASGSSALYSTMPV